MLLKASWRPAGLWVVRLCMRKHCSIQVPFEFFLLTSHFDPLTS
jgi:hypothetical protein